jgi:hypothetical protein
LPRQLDHAFPERRRGLPPSCAYDKVSQKEMIMPDPIWLDTNALQYALNGNAAINKQLSEYRRAGRQLLVTQQVEIEILYGNFYTLSFNPKKTFFAQVPPPDLRERKRTGMQRIGVEIDTKWRQVPTSDYESWVSMEKDNVSISDRRVLSEVKASAKARGITNPEILTAELDTKAMANQKLTGKWGVKSVKVWPTYYPAPEKPRVILADYPEDKEVEVTRQFKDHAVWEKLSNDSGEEKVILKNLPPVPGEQPMRVRTQLVMAGVGIAAQAVTSEMMSRVLDHFTNAIKLAKAEFDAGHPDPVLLRAQANLGPFKQAYEATLRSANLPTSLKVAEVFALGALTKDSDFATAKEQMDARIAKVVSAKDGTQSSYRKIGEEYTAEISKLANKVFSAAPGVQAIAADINKRGSVIKAAGEALQATFWKDLVITLQFPVVYYEWLNVKNTGDSLVNLGTMVLEFSTYISDRLAAYETLLTQLRQDMQSVTDQMMKSG